MGSCQTAALRRPSQRPLIEERRRTSPPPNSAVSKAYSQEPVPTGCEETRRTMGEDRMERTESQRAAQLYSDHVAAKAAVEKERKVEMLKYVRSRLDFTTSHTYLLGRCWDLREAQELTKSIVRCVAPGLKEVLENGSFGALTSTCKQNDNHSPTVLMTSPLAPTALSFENMDVRCKPLDELEKRLTVHSHWVSLIGRRTYTAKRKKNEADSKCQTTNYVSASPVYSSHLSNFCRDDTANGKQLSTPEEPSAPFDSLENNFHSMTAAPNSAENNTLDEGDTVEFCISGAKRNFAFVLSSKPSEDKDASFLIKRNLPPRFGVKVRQWNRVEFFYPNIQSLALAVVQAQPVSVNTSFGSAASAASLLRWRDKTGATSAVVAPLLLESFSSNSLKVSQSGSVDTTEDRFPESSLFCHCIALSPQLMHEIDRFPEGTPSPATSRYASQGDMTHFFEKHLNSVEHGSVNGSFGYHHPSALDVSRPVDPSVSTTKVIISSTSAAGGSLGGDFTQSGLRVSTQSLTEPHRTQPSSPTSPHSKQVLASIMVSCFEASIDPLRWKVNKYSRNPVNYIPKPSSREFYGDGTVTSIMYGGICVLEASSLQAVRELEKLLQVIKKTGKKSAKATQSEIRELLLEGALASSNGSGSGGGGGSSSSNAKNTANNVHNGSHFSEKASLTAASASNQLSCRILYCVGGSAIGGADPKYQSLLPAEKNSDEAHGFTKSLTPWTDIKSMSKALKLWVSHLISNVEFAEPTAVYVQKFSGILPALLMRAPGMPRLSNFEMDSDDNIDSTENEESQRGRNAVWSCMCMEGFLQLLSSRCSSDETEGFETIPMDDVSTHGASVGSTCSLPMPLVLHTGRALTIFQEDEGFHLSLSHRKAFGCATVTPSEKSPSSMPLIASKGMKRNSFDKNKPPLGMKSCTEKRNSGLTKPGCESKLTNRESPSQVASEGVGNGSKRRRVRKNPQRTESATYAGTSVTPVTSNTPETNLSTPQRPFSLTEDETQWERAMLEVKALQNELDEITESREKLGEELMTLTSNLDTLKRAFLPNAGFGNVVPIWVYLESALDEPTELPGNCVHLDTADWLACAAVLLTNPKNAFHALHISCPLTMQSLPNLGVLAGLLHHEHATSHLREISIRCDKVCGAALPHSQKEALKGKKRTKLFAAASRALRMISGAKNGGDDEDIFVNSINRFHIFPGGNGSIVSGPPHFLTPRQAEGIFLTFIYSVIKNSPKRIRLCLKGFPLGNGNGNGKRLKRQNTALGSFKGNSKMNRLARNGKNDEEVDEGNDEDEEIEGEVPEWFARPEATLTSEKICTITAWHNAERYPNFMLLRHRNTYKPFGWDAQSDGQTSYVEWTYGLGNYGEEAVVIREAENLLLNHLDSIFIKMQETVDERVDGDKKKRCEPLSPNGVIGKHVILQR